MAVTATDVAKVAGVSQRTVSNVVNLPDRVGAATRERVQAIIDELGYRPNPHARGLRTRRTGLIASRCAAAAMASSIPPCPAN